MPDFLYRSVIMVKILFYLALVGFILWLIHKFLSIFKVPKVGAIALFTGQVKAGKSTAAVNLVSHSIIRRLIHWWFTCLFLKIFRRGSQLPEKPLVYSNVPLKLPFGIGYVMLTEDLIFRRKRFAYGSVIYVNEAGLLMPKDIYQSPIDNIQVTLFNRFIGHETKGGMLVYDSQAISDLPAPCRRCVGQYFYVHHTVKWIPFFLICYMREDRYSEDGSVVSVNDQDVEDTLKRVVMRKATWKYFDAYCYSALTDQLPVDTQEVRPNSLKVDHVVSFDRTVAIVNNNIKR